MIAALNSKMQSNDESDDLWGPESTEEDERRRRAEYPDPYAVYENNPNWVIFLSTLQHDSEKQYVRRVQDFLNFKESERVVNGVEDLRSVVVSYFNEKNEEKKEDGSRRYKATNFQGWFVQLQKFYMMTEGIDLKIACPIMKTLIKNWTKNTVVKQAKVFTREELASYYEIISPDGYEKTLLRQVYAVIAVSFAGRTEEVYCLDWDQIELAITGPNEDRSYIIRYQKRAKQAHAEAGDRYTVINGEVEVGVIDAYLDLCRPNWRRSKFLEPKSGRFFVKLVRDSRGKIKPTHQVIGTHTAAKIGKEIAQTLGKPDWNMYSGHCFRRSAITLAAEAGLSVNQIKDFSGHRCDGVVQQYISHTEKMKVLQAEVVFSKKLPQLFS